MSRMMEYILNLLITLDCPSDWMNNFEDEEQNEVLPGDQQTLAWGLILYIIAVFWYIYGNRAAISAILFRPKHKLVITKVSPYREGGIPWEWEGPFPLFSDIGRAIDGLAPRLHTLFTLLYFIAPLFIIRGFRYWLIPLIFYWSTIAETSILNYLSSYFHAFYLSEPLRSSMVISGLTIFAGWILELRDP